MISYDKNSSLFPSDNQVFLVHSRLVENSLLCGGAFCDSVGSMFALTKYGSNVITEFGKS